ncbi:MAG: S-layer homology domain-containing protein [Clostridiales bacterium]|nr:S-layer homology domain-containing protein [Clostridiales bacterium]
MGVHADTNIFGEVLNMHKSGFIHKSVIFAATAALGLGLAMIPGNMAFADGVNIDAAFPDPEFRQYVKDEFDTVKDGTLSQAEINVAKKINLCDLGVDDPTGIEVFTAAEEIWCDGGSKISKLDFSKNTELKILHCGDNDNLKTLNVANCTKLEFLDCCNSGISKLDISKLTNLKHLSCYGTNLTSLDVSKNTMLSYLDCCECGIKEVDVINCPLLIMAMTEGDYSEGLDIRTYDYSAEGCYLSIPLNAIAGIPLIEKYFPNADFRDYLREGTPNGVYPKADTDGDDFLTVSELKAVKKINCGELGITSIKGIEYFINLELLWGGMSDIPSYDLSRNVNLTELHLGSNNVVEKLDLSKNTKLKKLDCTEMPALKKVKLGKMPDLEIAEFYETAITSLDVTGCPNIKKAVMEGESNVYVNCKEYTYNDGQYYLSVPVDCGIGIPIDEEHFPDSSFRELLFLNYDDNDFFFSIEELDRMTELRVFEDVDYSNISDISGIEYFPLKKLVCSKLHLNNLDLSKNPDLIELDCSWNPLLTSLDVTKNTKLEKLICSYTAISGLDVSKNKDLTWLECQCKYLLNIDISDCPNIAKAYKEDQYPGSGVSPSDEDIFYLIYGEHTIYDSDNSCYYFSFNEEAKIIYKKATPSPTSEPTKAPTATPTKAATPTATKAPTATPTKAPTKSIVSISLNKTSAMIKSGGKLQLKATVKGTTKAVTWKSSNTKVATVDQKGLVTGKQAGVALITASVAGKSATCKVTVLYKDVSDKNDFWFKPTNYLTEKGIVKGYDGQTKFKPDVECTRAQMVTFLWRLAGEPKPKSNSCDFKDVKKDAYYYKPVLWAVGKGITTGTSKTKFSPSAVCTRAQTVTFLWRMAGKPTIKGATNPFKDVKKTDYFYKAVIWASGKNIVAGYKGGTFKPQGKCLRRQMVTFLYKYDVNVKTVKK